MRIAVLGGTFNPVHIGHLMLAEDVRLEFGYDRIIFIPACIPPHKEYHAVVTDEQRLEMLRLAVKSNPFFEVDDCELNRKGVSYTFDTILELERKYGALLEGKIGLIIGDDLIEGFSKWHRPHELLEHVDLILGRRLAGGKIKSEFPFRMLENPVFPVSSSEFRERCCKNLSCRYLVPQSVYDYVLSKSLYGSEKGFQSFPVEKILIYAKEHEKPSRFEHSLRVASTARKMCRKYNLNEDEGYFAGISHDIAKDFPLDKMLSYAEGAGLEISDIEKAKPSLLHGKLASFMLEKDFSVKNKAVLEAVSNHTFGKPGMCDIAKVIYVADKIEPGRPHVTEEYLANFEEMTLNEVVRFVLEENISYLEANGNKVARSTFEFLDSLK